eukprot:TRINITY_DN897_c1_g1_i1.p1 TRINITY_DN897_c1_g1~~TRINITY_DN897_c1_g1_i1.p1  ORF type:complete len:647 (+),score=81.27 TRINITY_DN897_c1_g1_i1:41-1942(+)
MEADVAGFVMPMKHASDEKVNAPASEMDKLLQAHQQELLKLLKSWLTSQEDRLSERLSQNLRILFARHAQMAHSTSDMSWDGSPTGRPSHSPRLPVEETPPKTSRGPLRSMSCSTVSSTSSASKFQLSRSKAFDSPATAVESVTPRTALRKLERASTIERQKKSQTLQQSRENKQSKAGQAIVENPLFEPTFAFIILVNALLTLLEVHLSLESPTGEPPAVLGPIAHVMGIAFLIELLLKFGAYGREFFSGPDAGSNCFDLFLVISWFVELVIDIVQSMSETSSSSGANAGLSNMRLLRIVRMAKMFRLLRAAKVFKFVRALNLLVLSILTTLRSLIWASVLLTVVIFIFAICICQSVADAKRSCIETDCTFDPALQEYWGTLGRASLSLFQAITGGKDWDDVARPLMDLSGFLLLVLILFIIFAQFAVLNVVTGVFCQAAVESAQRDRELMVQSMMSNKKRFVEAISEQFSSMFHRFSSQHGSITAEAFAEHFHVKCVQEYFALLELDTSDAYMLFRLLDEDGSGAINVEEFVDGCLRLKGAARSIDLAKLSKDFKSSNQHFNDQLNQLTGQLRDMHDALDKEKRGAPLGAWSSDTTVDTWNHGVIPETFVCEDDPSRRRLPGFVSIIPYDG